MSTLRPLSQTSVSLAYLMGENLVSLEQRAQQLGMWSCARQSMLVEASIANGVALAQVRPSQTTRRSRNESGPDILHLHSRMQNALQRRLSDKD